MEEGPPPRLKAKARSEKSQRSLSLTLRGSNCSTLRGIPPEPGMVLGTRQMMPTYRRYTGSQRGAWVVQVRQPARGLHSVVPVWLQGSCSFHYDPPPVKSGLRFWRVVKPRSDFFCGCSGCLCSGTWLWHGQSCIMGRNSVFYPHFRKGFSDEWSLSKATRTWTIYKLTYLVPKPLKMPQQQATKESMPRDVLSWRPPHQGIIIAMVLSPRSLSLAPPYNWTSHCLLFLEEVTLLMLLWPFWFSSFPNQCILSFQILHRGFL